MLKRQEDVVMAQNNVETDDKGNHMFLVWNVIEDIHFTLVY